MTRQIPWWVAFFVGLVAGTVGTWGSLQFVPYINWHPIVDPLDHTPMVIRQDAKGDGRFGAPRSGHRTHQGLDLEAPMGSAIRAIRSGVVEEVGQHRGMGLYVRLQHDGGLESLYAHLETIAVTIGERVRQGQGIGTVGKTGNARSRLIKPHLHLQIFRDGMPIDPAVLGLALAEPTAPSENVDGEGGE